MKEYIKYLQQLLLTNNIPFREQNEFQQIHSHELDYNAINRYKRQMVLPEIGSQGQTKILKAKVLIIGVGGIGAPAALYLCGAGVGQIGLVDGDKVEISNLHRQVIHRTVGINKCESAKNELNSFNPLVEINTYPFNLDQRNAREIVSKYDLVLDASDNPSTRYLVNDVCMLLKKPLISGSSVGWEAQITVYGLDGPCYRCLFPQCPKNYTNCSDAGVFGVMPGLVGLVEAMEAIKYIIGQETISRKLILIDGLKGAYKTVKIRGKQQNCIGCAGISIEEYDYHSFCQIKCQVAVPFRGGYKEVTWKEFKEIDKCNSILLDVRPSTQFNIIKLDGFINVPYNDIDSFNSDQTVFVMCRRGNNSRLACEQLSQRIKNLYNIIGGIDQYAREFDNDMPLL